MTAETTFRRRDGTRFPVRVIAAPDPDDASHMIVTVEDISAEMGRRSEAEAIDAERRRIAHEIHDGVAQSLAGVRFKLALWQQAAGVPPTMGAALGELHDVLTAAIVDLRHMRERILDLGGTLDIHSSAGQGTKLAITLPPVGRENNHAIHPAAHDLREAAGDQPHAGCALCPASGLGNIGRAAGLRRCAR